MWHEFIDTFIVVELNLPLIHIFFRDAVSDLEKPLRDFPGGPGVKNPPANAGAWVQSVAQEDAASRRAATPVHHSCWTHALEPGGRNSWSPRATTPEAYAAARGLQQERPLQKPSHCKSGVAPTRHK